MRHFDRARFINQRKCVGAITNASPTLKWLIVRFVRLDVAHSSLKSHDTQIVRIWVFENRADRDHFSGQRERNSYHDHCHMKQDYSSREQSHTASQFMNDVRDDAP